ncbi:hypothetical protein FRC12_006708 [Ceratobasidium sp. 428]|nr:hypothetical protein FRC12_006708 [Ceratobasidium sp. 428]
MSYTTKEYSHMSSPASILSAEVESLGSDVESVADSGTDKAPESFCIPENIAGEKVFAPGDGDFELRVNGTVLQTHKYLLNRFSGLKSLIAQKAGAEQLDKPLTLEREHGVEDFLNTFKILCTSPIDGPLEFGSAILVSALRLATVYDYPALRTFAINNLEKAQLTAIERIQIAREFGFTSWEEPAYVELCERDEPITEQEANVLGMSTFVQIARTREKEQRRKGRLDNAQPTKDDERQSLAEGCIPNPGGIVNGPVCEEKTTEVNSGVLGTEKTMENLNTAISLGSTVPVDEISDVNLNTGEYSAAQGLAPRFIGCSPEDPTNLDECVAVSGALMFKIPSCECKAPPGRRCRGKITWNQGLAQGQACVCTISPCAARALEQLEVHQVAQASSITKLESATEEIRATLMPIQDLLKIHLTHARKSKSGSTGSQWN